MFGGCSVDNHWTSLSGHCPPNVHQMFTRVRQSPVDNVGDCEILFLPIALWLEDKEVISRSKADEYFWFGLPKESGSWLDKS